MEKHFALRDKEGNTSMRFIGLAGWCDNDGGIIPLKAAVNISPTCGLLETKTGTVGGRGPGQNGFPHCLICPFHSAQT